MAHERRDPNDRVMAPVMRFAKLPVMQAGSEQWSVDPAGKLLDACIQRVAAGGHRRGLDDAGTRIAFHQAHQADDAVAAHDTVGVEHDHVAVQLTPASAEVIEVAALAFDATLAMPVENVPEAADLAAQPLPGSEFGSAHIALVAVAEEEEIEVAIAGAGLDRCVRCTQARNDARHVLIADRHDNRRAGVARQGRRLREVAGN